VAKSISQTFVNGARNSVWISGWVKRQDKNSVRICSSSDAESGILVQVEPTTVVPANDSYAEVNCHIYGTHDATTDRRDLIIKAIHFKRPNISAVPRRIAMLQAAAQIKTPMAPIAEIKEGLMKVFKEQTDATGMISGMSPEQLVRDMVRDAQRGAPGQGGSFTNKAILTGFIGAKRVVMPTENEDAHILLSLHQYAETAKSIPIRIYGNVGSFAKELKALFPINVVGMIASRDVEVNGEIRRERFISANRQNIGMAAQADFFRREYPSWWLTAYAEHRKRAAARREMVQGPAVSKDSPQSAKSGETSPAEFDPDL